MHGRVCMLAAISWIETDVSWGRRLPPLHFLRAAGRRHGRCCHQARPPLFGERAEPKVFEECAGGCSLKSPRLPRLLLSCPRLALLVDILVPGKSARNTKTSSCPLKSLRRVLGCPRLALLVDILVPGKSARNTKTSGCPLKSLRLVLGCPRLALLVGKPRGANEVSIESTVFQSGYLGTTGPEM